MIEFLAHHLVTVYVVAAATAVVGIASQRWLFVAVPAAALIIAGVVAVRKSRRGPA